VVASETAQGWLPDWLNVMANKHEYLARLQAAIQQLHDCGANFRETAPVQEVFQGRTLWQGEVEVFDVYGHPRTKVCYAWSHRVQNLAGQRGIRLCPCSASSPGP
jgi:hypothetical protein